MEVALGGRDIRMAQQLLDRPNVRPTLEQMGGKGMPQHMSRHPLCNSGLSRRSPDRC